MGAEPSTAVDGMSISRVVLNHVAFANANPSHLQAERPNPILPRVQSPESHAYATQPLAQLRAGQAAMVTGLTDAADFDDGQGGGASLLARLRDLGFIAGARCEVIARMWLGGD